MSGESRRGQRDMSQPVQEWRLEVGRPDHGSRLDNFLGRHLRWRSRARLREAIEGGAVRVLPFKEPQPTEIGRLRPGLRLRSGQQVVVELPSPQQEPGAGERRWQPADLPVVWDDASILALGKPPHLNVYPTRRHRSGSLIELVHERERDRPAGGGPPTLCHRLDRETSGVVLFARHHEARAELQRQFEERSVRKTYLALVVGELDEPSGIVDLPIGRHPRSRVEIRQHAAPGLEGREALTRWRVRRRLAGRTLVELVPETGRQHQLRVHMAAIGHPLVGDKLYLGGDDLFLRSLQGPLGGDDLERLGLDRHALHAWRLEIDHPESGERRRLESPLWPDIAELTDR